MSQTLTTTLDNIDRLPVEKAVQDIAAGTLSAKDKYRDLCHREPSIPLFSKAWWLDAAAGPDHWDVVIIEKKDAIVASLPYVIQKKGGFTLLTHPQLTQTLGPWLRPSNASYSKQLSYQKELMSAMIEKLPRFDHCYQRWHYSHTNWLPFYWAGFTQTTRYTYVLHDLSNLEDLFSHFHQGKRQDIKKAEKTITVRFDIPAREFYEHHKMTLLQRNAKIQYSFELFQRLYDSGYKHDSACTIAGYDQNNKLHAALFIVWDCNSAYGLINTIDQEYKTSGAATLLTRDVIRHLSTRTKKFDFEGSMIPGVEASLRQYNAVQMPYFEVSKTTSRLYATCRFLNSLTKKGWR